MRRLVTPPYQSAISVFDQQVTGTPLLGTTDDGSANVEGELRSRRTTTVSQLLETNIGGSLPACPKG